MTNNNLNRFVPARITRAGKDFDYCPLDGDIPLLQFINTHSKRGTLQAKDYLTSYKEFLIWSHEIRLIDEETCDILELEAYCYEREAAGILNKAIIARGNFYLLIDHIMYDEPVPAAIIDELNAANDEANKHISYAMTPYGLMEGWRSPQEELAFPLWIITKSALKFLTSAEVKYIKRCHCGHFYLDTTKNRNRRYCNPLTCGKIRRSKKYLERLRKVDWVDTVD
jgi:predicted RNA-binding Zn ribbon-like protein